MFKKLLLTLFCLLLVSCGGLMLKNPQQPEVTLANISLVKAGLLEQQFRLQLRVQNPNDFDLPLDGLQLQIQLNNQPFASAVSNKAVTIPRYGSALVEVDATSTLATLTKQFKELSLGNIKMIRYTLNGKVHLSKPNITLPVAREGEVSLAEWLK